MSWTVIGCWIAAAVTAIHCGVGRFVFRHWPPVPRLGMTFTVVLGAVLEGSALWPVLSDPDPKSVPMSDPILIGLWLGLMAMIAVTFLSLWDNVGVMRTTARAVEEQDGEQKRSEHSGR